jgi:hypothetical protein
VIAVDENRRKIGLPKILLIFVLVVVGFLVVKKVFNSSSGGSLFSTSDCSTQLKYEVPQGQLKGVHTTMEADRCTGTDNNTGGTTHYVQVSLTVNGSTNDKAKVKDLSAAFRLQKHSVGGWQQVSPRDAKESDLSTDGSQVAYTKQVQWDVPHVPARAGVVVVLKTDKGRPARVKHVFDLP